MPNEKVVFASEEKRQEAILALDERPENLDKLEAIRAAEIVADGGDGNTTANNGEKPIVPPPEPKVEPKPDAVAAAPKEGEQKPVESFTLKPEDLPEGYKTPQQVLKAFGEQKDLLTRQGDFIKSKLNSSAAPDHTEAEKKALERAEKAEKELARLTGGGTKDAVSDATNTNIQVVQTEIQRIDALQAELDKMLTDDPEAYYAAGYQKKVTELSRLQTKNINALAKLYSQAQGEAAEAKRSIAEVVNTTKQSKEVELRSSKLEALYKEVDGIDIPEYKMSKPSKEAEAEYLQWRSDVAMAYYGRPAKTPEEARAALEQLQIKNPKLMDTCKVANVPVEPTENVKKFIELCELLDYRDGYRKDPATGKTIRLFQYDPETNQQIPLVLPSLKAAIQQKRLESGFYDNKADESFQKGAQSIAAAASRRDRGATELNTAEDQGQSANDSAWATKILTETDPEAAMSEYRRGNKTAVESLNKARKVFGLDPLTFEET